MSETPAAQLPSDQLLELGYQRAIELLEGCATEHGFLASTTPKANYRRVWARDGCIIGLAALMTEHQELIETCRRTLETLANYQGPHGEIPSNVDPDTDRVSYGGTAGRVDGNLWFAICCGQYWRRTGDDRFLQQMLEPMERVRFLLGAWEFNARGLLYVPLTGDWADEFVQHGYVLYDELLYLQAQREMAAVHQHLHGSADDQLDERVTRLEQLIHDNYWFVEGAETPKNVYHEVLYTKGRSSSPRRKGQYWMPFFSPSGYGYRFDALANALVSLLRVADDEQFQAVDGYIASEFEAGEPEVWLLPAFHPVITPKHEDWDELQVSFSYTFKNSPYEYHNGGLWPMVTGFYVAALARRGERERAQRYLAGIHRANALRYENHDWGFPEFLHGLDHTPGGTARLGWSAAAAVIGHHALAGGEVIRR